MPAEVGALPGASAASGLSAASGAGAVSSASAKGASSLGAESTIRLSLKSATSPNVAPSVGSSARAYLEQSADGDGAADAARRCQARNSRCAKGEAALPSVASLTVASSVGSRACVALT